MIGLLATLIAAAKRHTVFAVFSGLLSVWNIYAYPNGEADGIWIFGWILLVISIFMKTKTQKTETIVINNTSQTPSTETTTYEVRKELVDCNKFCSNCGNPIQLGQKYCPNCGKKVD